MDFCDNINDIDQLNFQLSGQCKCYNGTVVYHISSTLKTLKGRKKTIPFTKIAELLIQSYSSTSSCKIQDTVTLIPKIRSIYNRYSTLCKNKNRHLEELKAFLCTEFCIYSSDYSPPTPVLPSTRSPPRPSTPSPPRPSTPSPPRPSTPSPPRPSTRSPPRPSTPSPPRPSTRSPTRPSTPSTPVKTRRDCLNCSSAKKANFSLASKVKTHKSTVHKFKKSAAAVRKELNLRTKNQKLKRYSDKIVELKQIIKRNNIKLVYRTKKNVSVTSALKNLERVCSVLDAENKTLKNRVRELSSELKAVNTYSEYLTTSKEDTTFDSEVIELKCGKEYSDQIRRCVYHQLVCDVPVNSCGGLIKTIVKIILNKEIKKVPSPATCSQMAYELGVLSSIHLIDFMLKQGDTSLCLSWDATTIEGAHVNEIHLTANKVQCLVLDVRHLPGGKSSDYVTHIISALSDAAGLYSEFHGLPATQVLTTLKSMISCTLADRAAVNAVVTRELCNELDSQLLLLNCNVHPLDSVARDVKTSLVKFDTQHGIQGSCFGYEGTAANLIKAISVLRYKDGKGDPVGFKNFLHQQNIPVGTFPRYVGNRLHVLFHLAGLVLLHEDKLESFIQNQSTAAGLLRSSILKDLRNKRIMAQIWSLAVVRKTFSGPWMTKFYSSAMSNLEMGNLVQLCMAQLQTWIADVGVLLQPQLNVFGEQIDGETDYVTSSIVNYIADDEEIQRGSLEPALLATQSVLSRQLVDFVNGGKYSNPSRDILDRAASAPTHNISSERTLGSLDRLWRRAPNATMGFLSGKVRCKMNKTLQWLDSNPPNQRSSLISFAVRHAKKDRYKKPLVRS